jgi:hypothetical protein
VRYREPANTGLGSAGTGRVLWAVTNTDFAYRICSARCPGPQPIQGPHVARFSMKGMGVSSPGVPLEADEQQLMPAAARKGGTYSWLLGL